MRLSHRTIRPVGREIAFRFDGRPFVGLEGETIAAALRDSAPEVRRAAAEVLLWDGERRWGWVRFSVHAALADIGYQGTATVELSGGDGEYLKEVNRRFDRILNGA